MRNNVQSKFFGFVNVYYFIMCFESSYYSVAYFLTFFFAVVGILTIVLSVVVFVSSEFGFLALVLMLSFTFMFNGIARIVQGITGIQETDV